VHAVEEAREVSHVRLHQKSALLIGLEGPSCVLE
jgi:hypothetical protein